MFTKSLVVGVIVGLAVPAWSMQVPGRGAAAPCAAVWDTADATVHIGQGRKPRKLVCEDGDPTCDTDQQVNGVCRVALNACVVEPTDGCAAGAVSSLRLSRTIGHLTGFVPPATPASGASCGTAGVVELRLRGRHKDRPSRPMRFGMQLVSDGKRGENPITVQCVAPGASSACPDRPAAGMPKEFTFTVADEGTDLDNGWTGVSHNFPVPAGSQFRMCLSDCDADTNPSCSGRGETGRGTLNGTTFGPPLPLLAAGVPVCVVNRFDGPVTGTFDLRTGAMTGSLNLLSDVYTGTPATEICPRCDTPLGAAAAVGTTGRCSGGQNPGSVCTVEGAVTVQGPFGKDVYPLSSQCLPAGAPAGTIRVGLPLTTADSTLAGPLPCTGTGGVPPRDDSCGAGTCSVPCSGPHTCARVVDGQCVDVKGGVSQLCCSNNPDQSCFPTRTAPYTIARTGSAAEPSPAWPDPTYPKTANGSVLAATFCEDATGANTVDMVTGLPGPGALVLPGGIEITAQQ